MILQIYISACTISFRSMSEEYGLVASAYGIPNAVAGRCAYTGRLFLFSFNAHHKSIIQERICTQ